MVLLPFLFFFLGARARKRKTAEEETAVEEKEEDRDGWRREGQESIRLLISSFVFTLQSRALLRKEKEDGSELSARL